MRRWRLRLAILAAGAALGAASLPTLSAWTSTTSNPSGTISAIPDWVAPAVDRLVVQKTQGGVANHVKPGGTYHVCSKVAADTGNPASGLAGVVTDVGALTTGVVNQVLGLLGGSSPCAATDNRDSGALTVASNATAGAKTISLQVTDNAANSRTRTESVTVDGTAPSAVAFATQNKTGGTAGLIETGDTITLTFSEPIDPHAVIPGWDGTGTQPIYPYFVNDNKDDRLQFYRAGSVQTPLTATSGSTPWIDLQQNYVTGNVYFTSTIEVAGNAFVITLGAPSTTGVFRTDTATAATRWSTNAGLFDYAGNALGVTTLIESGTADSEF
jgi:hypothetical protein